ncbi:MAG TPA: glycosyltransferase, partial [Methylomirabilota bacterium]|nr:glycosyltransferase [Methylomirabilota bacterium]
MGIRVVVIDDNPHVRWEGRVYPVNATFHRFLTGVLDVPGAPVASIVHCVPLRDASAAPATLPLDPRLEVVGTAPFEGIGGFVRHAPRLLRANAALLRPVIASADLVWIKVPASNALLAGWLAWRARVPRFGYVAGSALAVARGRRLGLPAQVVGLLYDVAGRLAGGRQRIVVGRGIVDGGGIVTSLVEPDEIRDVSDAPWPAIPWRLRLAWAGRLAGGKGLEVLIDALALLVADEEEGHRVELVIVGDGPARASLEARAQRLGIGDRIHWLGYVADRATYMEALASCDLFVFPSPAEGFPKVILDAMAVGLPVIASGAGSLADLGDRLVAVGSGDAAALAQAI